MATNAVSWVTSLLIGFLLSCDLFPKVSGWSKHVEASSHRIQVVDNDPEFLVGANGMDKPFCFHLESPENEVIRLLQDPNTGIVVNARVFRDKHTNKSYLGTILVAGDDVRILARQNDILINDRPFKWQTSSPEDAQGMDEQDVKGHRVLVGANTVVLTFRKKQITLIVVRHFVTRDTGGDDSAENEASESSEEKNNNNNNNSNRGDSPPGDAATRRGRRRTAAAISDGLHDVQSASFKENVMKVDESSYISDTINKLSSAENAENSVVDFLANQRSSSSSSSSHHRKRHESGGGGGGEHRKRHRKARGKRYENSHFRPDGDRLRRVPSYNDVIQRIHSPHVTSTEGKTVYLGVYISNSQDFSNVTHGLLGQFLYKNVTMERMNYKNGRVKAKFLINQNPKRKTIALLSLRKNVALNKTRACWRVRHQGRDVIDGGYHDYVVPSMYYTKMLVLPPRSITEPEPVTPGQPWPAPSTTTPNTLEETSSLMSSTTTPAPPTYPTCVYETHHRVEPIGTKTNPKPMDNKPYFVATSNSNDRSNNHLFRNTNLIKQNLGGGNNNNNNVNSNDNNNGNGNSNNGNNRNGWIVGVNQGKGKQGGVGATNT